MSTYFADLNERSKPRRGRSIQKPIVQAAADGDATGMPSPPPTARESRAGMMQWGVDATQTQSSGGVSTLTQGQGNGATAPSSAALQEEKRSLAVKELEDRLDSEQMLFLDDTPTARDDYNFAYAIEPIKDMIIQPRIGTPFVIGIDGQWGSGKTSFCLGLEKKLKQFDAVITCWINAWRFDEVNQLATAFLDKLSDSIADRGLQPNDRDAFDTEMRELKERAQKDATWLDGGTETHLGALLLATFDIKLIPVLRLVVFLDDLDRCSPQQLDAALKFLRPLIGTWGVVVILPCDRLRVLGALDQVIQPLLSFEDQIVTDSEQAAAPAKTKEQLAAQERERRELTLQAFLERIVRVWIAMPQPSPASLIAYLGKIIKESDDYLKLIAHVVDGNPRRLKVMITAYNLTTRFVGANNNLEKALQGRGLSLRTTTLKLFLLRHFWHDLFDTIRTLPRLLLTAQAAAQQASRRAIYGQALLADLNYSDPIIWQSTFDLPLRRLLTLDPQFTDTHFTDSNEFWEPLNEIVNAVYLCPPTTHKAEQREMRVLRYAGAIMPDSATSGQATEQAAKDAAENDPNYAFFFQRIAGAGNVAAASAQNEPLAPQRIKKDDVDERLKRQANAPQNGFPPDPESDDDLAALMQAALGVGNFDDNKEDDDDEAQTLDINKMNVSDLIPVYQRLWMRARLARSQRNRAGVRRLAPAVRAVVARVQFLKEHHQADEDDLSSVSSVLGNIAVSFETSGELEEAEEFYKAAIELAPTFGGTHLQYADFLVDRGRLPEASEQLDLGVQYVPDDRRIPGVRAKLDMKRSATNPAAINDLRRQFDSNPGNSAVAAAYLSILSDMPASEGMTEFERVCMLWWEALPSADKPDARRALADYYATHNRRADAITIYNEILKVITDPEDRRTTLHNLATLEASSGDRASALAHWTEAYNANTKDAQVVAGFVSALINWNMFDLAEKVSSNQPIPNPPTDIPRM